MFLLKQVKYFLADKNTCVLYVSFLIKFILLYYYYYYCYYYYYYYYYHYFYYYYYYYCHHYCNLRRVTCNLQPATCNLQPATCNLQPANYTLRAANHHGFKSASRLVETLGDGETGRVSQDGWKVFTIAFPEHY